MPYFLYDGQKTLGPFQPAELIARPGFGAATLVFPAGATTADAWKPAGTFPDIAAALAPAPPPPPPPAAPARSRSEITLIMPPPRVIEPDPPPAAPKPEPVAPKPAAPAGSALGSPGDKLVLVVDDDDGVRSLIEMTAMTQGFQVATATNGYEATSQLAKKPADLIVTDLMMPGQGGYEFLRTLQAAGGGRHVPVFVVTGSTLEESTIQLIRQEANVVEFIAKPIRIPAFAAALHKHLKTAPK